ncbi:MAG: aspartate aminotransferase family protein [Armatimonadetes bacterium]|nr:aspartate aminotransferase family protein [Armatimonadota bacterium]
MTSAPLPRLLTEVPGPRSRELARRLRRVESPHVTYLSSDFPIFWDRAEGCLVTDVDGNTFLDMTAAFGVASVGHSHPHVVAAVQAQSQKLLHGMGDVHPSEVKVALCERIAEFVPIPDAQVILGQNGGDAVEAALKTAILATGKRGVLAFEGGYHGLTYGALDATARADFRAPFLPQLGRFTSHLPYGGDLLAIEARLRRGDIGAVLAEPIQGRGGIVVPPPGWLAGLREICDRTGTLLILDEIFTGWGRTGRWFACQSENVVPDILCVGKAMGGGLPLSACVASRPLMACWGESRGEALHTSTFLGNPLACAAALAALAVLEGERLPERAERIGAELAEGLRRLQRSYPTLIRDVRGRGLMLGLEMASPELALQFVPGALAQGLIVLPAGDGRVLEFVPPLVVLPDQIAWCLACLQKIFEKFFTHSPA